MFDTVFVPRGAEEQAVRRALARAGAVLRVEVTGIGAHAAGRAADAALRGPALHAALVVGLCGLVSPAFAVGDALVYRELLRAGGPTLALDRALGDALARRTEAQSGARALDVAAVVTDPGEKALLGSRYGVDAVDMESYALVERLTRAGIAVAVLRVGSDAVGDALPDLNMALDGSGGIDAVALGIAMLRRPFAAAALARNATRALRVLERAVAAAFAPEPAETTAAG